VRAPVFDEICAETGVTLPRYMMELSRENPELRDLESLIGGIQQVSDEIACISRQFCAEFAVCLNSRLAKLSLTW
jgi:hypothetical protein